MSTRSLIGRLDVYGHLRLIYCHSDGYPGWNGWLLTGGWSDTARVSALLDLGDLSCITKDRSVVAYHRDRGEEFNPPALIPADMLRDYMADTGTEYAYVWDAATPTPATPTTPAVREAGGPAEIPAAPGRWLWMSRHDDPPLRPLAPDLAAIPPEWSALWPSVTAGL